MTPRGQTPVDRPLDCGAILQRLRTGRHVRRTLEPWGRLRIDRLQPFLCVYRKPPRRADHGTAQLATGVASYLTASGGPKVRGPVAAFIREICRELARDFGAVLLVEIWAGGDEGSQAAVSAPFRIVIDRDCRIMDVVDELESTLADLKLPTIRRPAVEQTVRQRAAPRGMGRLAPAGGAGSCHVLGLEVPPIYRNGAAGDVFPVIHRALRRGLTLSLNRAIYRFIRTYTIHRPVHYHALGAQSLTKAVWEVDAELAEVSDCFDLILLTTPRNVDPAWSAFLRSRFERPPRFSYRPRPFDIALAKRKLYRVPVERIEDPTVSELFREQQDEIDRKLTMIADRGTRRFVHESQQLFGRVDDGLMSRAVDILERIPPAARESSGGKSLGAHAFAERAREEIGHLRMQSDRVLSGVEVRGDITGLLVTRGRLLVGASTVVAPSRVEALVQHEVGTHVVTYFNGLAQPFRQLRVGLPGHEELQEGLAVLSEYLVGGMSRLRLRLLAARVVAVRRMLEGADFVEVFRELHRGWELPSRLGFTTSMRVFRGGGHTKDAVYLRGLLSLLGHMKEGHSLEPLYVGKIGLHHLPFIEELTFRKVLVAPPLRPRYLDRPDVQERLRGLQRGMDVRDLAGPVRPWRRSGS